MKKAFAAVLAAMVGIFGYTIADKTIDERVSNLESAVSSQQEEIESLHGLGNYYHETTTKAYNDETTTEKEYIEPTTSRVYQGSELTRIDSQNKYMYRLYSNGAVRYVPTYDYNNSPTTNEYPTLPDEYEEYFAYITSSSAVVTSVRTESESFTYYDSNYDIQTKVNEKSFAIITVTVTGKTDPVFAGRRIFLSCLFDNNKLHYSYYSPIGGTLAVINEDGTFTITNEYECSNNYGVYSITGLQIKDYIPETTTVVSSSKPNY